MKQTLLIAMIFALIAPLGTLSHANSGKQKTKQYSAYLQIAQSSNRSLESAVQSIKQKTGGRILSTKTTNKNGLRTYKIKVLLPSGKVQTFKVSAQ